MTYGGYPRVIIEQEEENKQNVLKQIYSTLFLYEVKDIASFIESQKLQKLFVALSNISGSIIEYTKLANIIGLRYEKVKELCELLESLYCLKIVRPFFSNKLKEIIKAPKIYFLDPGLRNCIIDDFRNPEIRTDKGELFELLVNRCLFDTYKNTSYWRTKNNFEIDFIVEAEQKDIYGFECKYSHEWIKKSTTESFTSLYPEHKGLTVVSLNPDYKKEGSIGPWDI